MDIYGRPINDSFGSGGVMDGDLQVTGLVECTNLNVSNTLTASVIITETELEVEDPLILCGKDNPSDSLNLGVLEQWNDGSNKWSGLIRSKNDKRHHLLEDAASKPTASSNISLLDSGHLVTNQLTLKMNSDNAVSVLDIENNDGRMTFSNTAGIPKFLTIHDSTANTLITSGDNLSLTLNGGTGAFSLNSTAINIGTGGTFYSLPVARGANGQTLVTDGSGVVSWSSAGGGGTLQSVYDASSSPQITTDFTNDEFVIKSHTTSGTMLDCQDSGSNSVFSVEADGMVSCSKLTVVTPNDTEVAIYEATDAASPGSLHFYKSRNTIASPTVVQNNDFLGNVKAFGYDGTGYKVGGSMNIKCTEAWSESARGCEYSFWTVKNSSTSTREVMVIGNDASLGIGELATRYTLPPARSLSNGQVLRSDASGVLSWQSLTPSSTTDNSIPKFNTDGLLEQTGITIDDTDNMTGIGTLSATELSADNASLKTLGFKNDVGTDRFNLDHDQASDTLLLENATGVDIRSTAQDGSFIHRVSGTEVFEINNLGQMTLGDFGAINSTSQLSISNPSNTEVALYESSNASSPASLHFYKSRNTPQDPQPVISSSFLGSCKGYGFVDGSFAQGCNFNFQCSQSWTTGAHGSKIVFNTVKNNETTPIVRFVFDHDGQLGIGESAERYTLPSGRGTSGEVLRETTGTGDVQWVQLTPATTTATSLARFNTTGVLSDSNWLLSASNDLTNIGGNLGLGTATPGSILDIKDGATQLLSVDDGTGVTVGVDLRYQKGCAEFYAENNATTTTTTFSSIFYNVLFSTAASDEGQAVGFTVDQTTNHGRITYNGTRDRICHGGVSLSFKSDTNNILVDFEVFMNGVALPQSHIKLFYGNGVNKFQSSAMHFMPTMSNGDYIELRVATDNAGAVITVEEANIFLTALPNTV